MGRNRQHLKYLQHYRLLVDNGMELICGICSLPIIHREKISVDHIHPLSLGGSQHRYNFQPAHIKCNSRRGNKPITNEKSHPLTKEKGK